MGGKGFGSLSCIALYRDSGCIELYFERAYRTVSKEILPFELEKVGSRLHALKETSVRPIQWTP
jgi:hypothetical protein